MSNNRNMSRNRFGDHTVVVQGSNYAPINAGFHKEDSPWFEKISQENPAYHKKRIFESKGPFLYESFCWILDNPDFNKWRNTEKSGVFWITGDPGKGKTMLLGGLVDDFEANPQMVTNLAYFFCQATDSRINTAAAVVGGLIVSFIKQHHELRSYIRTKYEDDLGKLNGPDRWYILRDIFEKATQHSTLPNPVCVVDALDECEQEHGRKQLLRLIVETSYRVKWLISSRNVTEIERELQAIDSHRRLSLELKGNADYVTKSVDLFIDKSIQNIVALKGDEELFTKATNTLKGKANGTFLWVALVIEQLRHTKHRNVEAALDEIPEGLDNLYNLILKRLAKQKDKDAYQVILSTVTLAERPLCLEELLTFISYQWKCYKPTYTVRDIRDLVKDCASFLSIRNDAVYFIHQSVKDYIMGTAVKVIFPSGIEYQHHEMFTNSLDAMSRVLKHNIYGIEDLGSGTTAITPPNPDPLAPIAYCCIFWVEHLLRSYNASPVKILLKNARILHSFLKVKYLCWLESLALLRILQPQGMDAIQKLKDFFSGYHKSETNKHHRVQLAGPQRVKERRHYRFIHRRYRNLSPRTYISHAYTFFYNHHYSHLRSFIEDGYRFIYYWKDLVRGYPLQLYYSAITFEDKHSAIYKAFQHIIRSEFQKIPTAIKIPTRQFHLVQNIELNCRGYVYAILSAPDSSVLCAFSSGGTVAFCRTDTCSLECVIQLDMEERKHTFFTFSRDSKHLVSISTTGIVQEWAVDCGTQVQNFSLNLNTSLAPRPQGSPSAENTTFQEEVVALSYHGDLAASACRTLSGTTSAVKVWTLDAGGCKYVIDRSHVSRLFNASFSTNSAMIALVDRENAEIYSVQTGREITKVSHYRPFSLFPNETIQSQFSPNSKLLFLLYNSQDMCLWCTKTWTRVRRIDSKFPLKRFDLSPKATMLISTYRGAVLIVSMDTGEPLLKIKCSDELYGPIFLPDWSDTSLLASFSHGAVQIWRACFDTSGKSSRRQLTKYLSKVVISPKSKLVAACDDEGNIEIRSGESGEYISAINENLSIWPPVFSPNSELVACAQENGYDIQVWHVGTGKPLHLLEGEGYRIGYAVTDTAFSDDSVYLVAGYSTGRVKIWNVDSGRCLYQNDGDNEDACISKVAFSPGSRYIATATTATYTWDRRTSYTTRTKLENRDAGSRYTSLTTTTTVCIWDWRTANCTSQTTLEVDSSAENLTFCSDATVLVIITGSDGHSLYTAEFYNSTSGTCLGHISIGHSDCLPIYDPEKDHIVSDRFRWCKRSSWEHWDTTPQSEYFYIEADSLPGHDTWICCGGYSVFQVPRSLSAKNIQLSNSLLVFNNFIGELYIIQLHR